MAKIVLGKRPKSFTRKITVQLPEGGSGDITVNYLYRTRKEFGEFMDEVFKDAGFKPGNAAEEEVSLSLAQALSKTVDQNAAYIMRIADGWDLAAEFTLTNVEQLCDELPGVAIAMIDTYRQAVAEGRLGN